MRIRHGLMILGSLLAAAPAAVADAGGLKIGYVNVVRVVDEAPQGEEARRKLAQEFGPRDKELVKMRRRVRELEKDLESGGGDEQTRRKKERELVSLRRRLRRASQEFREDYNLRRNEELGALQKIVYKAIIDIAKGEGYDLVLHEGAIYASDKIDITEKVLQRLRAK